MAVGQQELPARAQAVLNFWCGVHPPCRAVGSCAASHNGWHTCYLRTSGAAFAPQHPAAACPPDGRPGLATAGKRRRPTTHARSASRCAVVALGGTAGLTSCILWISPASSAPPGKRPWQPCTDLCAAAVSVGRARLWASHPVSFPSSYGPGSIGRHGTNRRPSWTPTSRRALALTARRCWRDGWTAGAAPRWQRWRASCWVSPGGTAAHWLHSCSRAWHHSRSDLLHLASPARQPARTLLRGEQLGGWRC